MDDDGYPINSNSLQELLDYADKIDNDCIMLNSIVLYNGNSLTFGLNGIRSLAQAKQISAENSNLIEHYIAPFNGTLISKGTYRRIGNIRKDFIIHGDEAEYWLRALKADVYVATLISSLFFHPLNNIEKKYVYDGKVYSFCYTPPWMEYYEARNHVYIRRKYLSKDETRIYIKRLRIKALCAPSEKIKYWYYIHKGIYSGIFDNLKPLNKQLYLADIEDFYQSIHLDRMY